MKDGSTAIGIFTARNAAVDLAWNFKTSARDPDGDSGAPSFDRRWAGARRAARRGVRVLRRRVMFVFIPRGPRAVLEVSSEGRCYGGEKWGAVTRDVEPDPHAASRERRRRREREGMQVQGRSVKRLAELSTRPGHSSSAAAPAAAKRRRATRRRGR